MQGWIGLHRKLMDNPVWSDPNYLKLWTYCLFKASHKEHEILVGSQLVKLERGQFISGRESLESDMNRGVKPKQRLDGLTWIRYLKNLEKWQMLNIKSTNKYSLVTVANYGVYQDFNKQDEQQVEQQLNSKRTTNEQQLNTNKNVNKGNNDKNELKPSSHKFSISDMGHAKLLFELMQRNNPDVTKPNFDKWADTFRLMRTVNKRTNEQIKWLIEWTQNDEFWKSNILSPSKLRKQWDALVLKAKAEHDKKKQLKLGAGKKTIAREEFDLSDD